MAANPPLKLPNDRVGEVGATASSKSEGNWVDLPYPNPPVGNPPKDANNLRAERLIGKKGV